MEKLLFANNAESTAVGSGGVVGGILSLGGTSLNLTSGGGSSFPSPGFGEAFFLTIFEKPAGTEENIEVVKVTSRTADNLTIVRNIEGATYGYPTVEGRTVYVAHRLTALTVDQFLQSDQNLADLNNAATARTNLGLEIGVDVQAHDADLDAWAGIAPSSKQDALVSGTNIKTVNGVSLLGSGGVTISGAPTVSVETGTSVTGAANTHHVLTNAAATTVTLPASPTAGDIIWITVANGRTTNVLARNGKSINGVAEDMTIDNAYATVVLRWIDATRMWRII